MWPYAAGGVGAAGRRRLPLIQVRAGHGGIVLSALLAALPLLLVLLLMLGKRWSGVRAGLAGLCTALVIGWLGFGLTWRVFWVSQVRGLMLALYVLYIIWPALLLYNLAHDNGGITLVERWLADRVSDRPAAGLLFAWCLSAVLEGIAGFGVPLAVISPMLLSFGFSPVVAVTAVAVGHAWSVTFGDMGVVFEALLAVVRLKAAELAPAASLMLGLVCLGCGYSAATIIGLRHRRWAVAVVALAMAGVQAGLAGSPLRPLAALMAGLGGLAVGVLLFGRFGTTKSSHDTSGGSYRALLPYVCTTAILSVIAFFPALRSMLGQVRTTVILPEVTTRTGWVTAAGQAKAIDWLTHPGTAMLAGVLLSLPWLRRAGSRGTLLTAARKAEAVAAPASLGIITMMGLAMLMDHAGMTQTLAIALSRILGRSYPLVAGYIGMLGAFTTGSNTNSNVLFGPLQLQMAQLLVLDRRWLLAAQTAGGALGSMVAPAKLVVGCATVGLIGKDGLVLRRTFAYALAIALVVGVVVLALA